MASLEQNLREVFSQVGVQERKQLLANIFLFPSFDEEDDLRTSIVLDVYYDALFFLVNHGFPWREVVKFFEIFRILWQEIQGIALGEAITLFQQHLSSIVECSSDNNLKSVVDHTFSTLFQHYKLYQFVLTRERAQHITKVHSIVEPPRSLPAMSEGVQKSTWDEEQKLKQIDALEQRKRQEREAFYECEIQQALKQLEEPLSQLEIGAEQLTKEELTTVIGDVTAREAAVTDAKIRHKIDEVHDSIEYQYMRANIGHVYDALGKKSASSRVSKKRSGKK